MHNIHPITRIFSASEGVPIVPADIPAHYPTQPQRRGSVFFDLPHRYNGMLRTVKYHLLVAGFSGLLIFRSTENIPLYVCGRSKKTPFTSDRASRHTPRCLSVRRTFHLPSWSIDNKYAYLQSRDAMSIPSTHKAWSHMAAKVQPAKPTHGGTAASQTLGRNDYS